MSAGIGADLTSALRGATKEWKRAKRRSDRVEDQALSRMSRASDRTTIRDAAFDVMETAYNHASSNGRYYAHARQIMYKARPLVLEATGGECWSRSSYFTQTLLKDYLEEFEPDWKIAWDARGHFHEPHTGHSLGLGGIEVGDYIRRWTAHDDFPVTPIMTLQERIETKGPRMRFGAALFVEKEGFHQILEDAGIATRFDLAIFSSKGVPNRAACEVAHTLHADGVRVFVIRDFDYAGFKIVQTLRRGTRLAPGTPVVDLGLRLTDVEVMELDAEPVSFGQKRDPRHYLRRAGASEEERNFLVSGGMWSSWLGQRVELNAMTSEQLVRWLEDKLEEEGVEKVVPDEITLGRAYQRAVFRRRLEREAGRLAKELGDVAVPEDLATSVREHLDDCPQDSWDEAVSALVDESATDAA